MRRLALLAWLASAAACGGSSSETPPPLEPDPARLRGNAEGVPNAVAEPRPGEKQTPAEAAVIAPITAPRIEPATSKRRSGSVKSTWGTPGPRVPATELAPEPEL